MSLGPSKPGRSTSTISFHTRQVSDRVRKMSQNGTDGEEEALSGSVVCSQNRSRHHRSNEQRCHAGTTGKALTPSCRGS